MSCYRASLTAWSGHYLHCSVWYRYVVANSSNTSYTKNMQIGKIELSTSSVLLKAGSHWANSKKMSSESSLVHAKMMPSTKDLQPPVCLFLGVGMRLISRPRKTGTVKPTNLSVIWSWMHHLCCLPQPHELLLALSLTQGHCSPTRSQSWGSDMSSLASNLTPCK